MNHIFFIFGILIFSLNSFATEQESDLLIIENDTIYLKVFPLDNLPLLIYRPFGIARDAGPSSGCKSGHRAIWRIIDNKLYLEKILRCSSDNIYGEENIQELFKKNYITYFEHNGMIWADWCTLDFYRMTFSIAKYYPNEIYLYNGWNEKKKDKKAILKVEKGVITKNELK